MADRAEVQLDVEAPVTSPFVTLRRRTTDVHERLEAALDLCSPTLDAARYTAVLTRFATVVGPLESAIARRLDEAAASEPAVAPLARLARDRRQPALRADLAALGGSVGAPADIDAVATVGAAVGAMYVLEGSRLGGALVARHVRAVLGPAVPCAFFDGDGVDAPSRWQAFRHAARPVLASDDALEQAVAGAFAAFTAFDVALAAP